MNLPGVRLFAFITAFFMIAYWVIIPEQVHPALAMMTAAARLVVSLMVVVVYGYSIYQLYRERVETHNYHGLIFGIWLIFFAEGYNAALTLVWRWNDRPDWGLYHFWLFPSYLTSIAALYHIAVPGAIDGRIPRRNIIILVVAVGLALLLATLILVASIWPDMQFLKAPFWYGHLPEGR